MKLYRAQNLDGQPPCRWETRVVLDRAKHDGMLLLDQKLRDLFLVKFHGKVVFPKPSKAAQLCSVARKAVEAAHEARSKDSSTRREVSMMLQREARSITQGL